MACKRQRRGSLGAIAEMYGQGMPQGPLDLRDVMQYPDRANEALFAGTTGALRRARFDLLRSHGFCLTSDYSGIMCFEDSFLYHLDAVCGKAIADREMCSYRACDNDELVQDVIKSRTRCRPCCIFDDIMGRLPDWAAKEIAILEPPSLAPVSEKALQYERMLEFLMKERAKIFTESSVARCVIHDRMCNACPQMLNCSRAHLQSDVLLARWNAPVSHEWFAQHAAA
jgi:hypothetical protein